MIVPRESVARNYNYEYNCVSLWAFFSVLIRLLFHVFLNFLLTNIALAFNIFSIFTLIDLYEIGGDYISRLAGIKFCAILPGSRQ